MWLHFKVSKYDVFQITISQICSVWVLSVQTESWSTCIWRALKSGFSFYPEAFKLFSKSTLNWSLKNQLEGLPVASGPLQTTQSEAWDMVKACPSTLSSGIWVLDLPPPTPYAYINYSYFFPTCLCPYSCYCNYTV